MLIGNYIPYWEGRTEACEVPWKIGGVPYSESVSSLTATAIFYFLAPFTVHMLLNTFVWGLAPAPGMNAASKRASTLARELPMGYRAKPNDEMNYFKIFGRTITGVDTAKICSPLKWLSLAPESGIRSEDMILHDPKFWMLPSLWWQHFKMENRNSSYRAFLAYVKAMTWKVKLLMKLTLGVWSESQIEQFQIRHRSKFVDMSAETNEDNEAMLSAVGRQQCTVW